MIVSQDLFTEFQELFHRRAGQNILEALAEPNQLCRKKPGFWGDLVIGEALYFLTQDADSGQEAGYFQVVYPGKYCQGSDRIIAGS